MDLYPENHVYSSKGMVVIEMSIFTVYENHVYISNGMVVTEMSIFTILD